MSARCRYHCAGGCGQHFTSLHAFDAHRAGDHQEGRYCLDCMDDPRFVLKTEQAVCDLRSPTKVGVRLWQLASDLEVSERFRGRVSSPSEAELDRRAA